MEMKKISLLVLMFVFLFSFLARAESEEKIVFSGLPIIKISEGGVERVPEKITDSEALSLKCTIIKIDDKYYWTTRENTPMVLIESGAYMTYLAVNGVGYVRVVSPEFKNLTSLTSQTEKKFDYVEHLLQGLRSVTYYGVSTQ
jgi:hypothetical protein